MSSRRRSKPRKTPRAPTDTHQRSIAEPVMPSPTPAGMMVRLFCLIYDGLLLVALWMIVSAILVPLGTSPEAAAQKELTVVSPAFQHFVLLPALIAITWLFYGYFWKKAGQTLGMQTWRLKVLRHNGEYLRWVDGVLRCAAACVFPFVCGALSQALWHSVAATTTSIILGFLGNYLWMLWSPHRLAWHDQVSATLVWRLPPEPKKKRSFFAWFSEKND